MYSGGGLFCFAEEPVMFHVKQRESNPVGIGLFHVKQRRL